MAKRRKSRKLLVTGAVKASDLASTVIDTFVSKVETDVTTWATNYTNNLREFAKNKDRVELAKKKLGAWYGVFIEIVYPNIVGAYAGAKSEYIKRIVAAELKPKIEAVVGGSPAGPGI
jgi:hypothetical protein